MFERPHSMFLYSILMMKPLLQSEDDLAGCVDCVDVCADYSVRHQMAEEEGAVGVWGC